MTLANAHPLTQVIQVDRERCVNCHACIAVCPVKVCNDGSGACDDMTVAIHNGLNRPENCHHYLAKERELSQQQLAEYRDHLENLVADRTAELRMANDRLSREVRERTRAEEAFQDSQQKLRDIIYGSPIAQFVIDKDHKVLYWNQALERFSGIRGEQMVGTCDQWKAFYSESRPCLLDLLVDNDHAAIARYYQGRCRRSTLLEGAYEGIGFFPAIGPEGKWLYFTAAAIKDSKGATVGAVETLEDITESRRTEIQLARSRQAAEAANRAKSEFLANMSHEIRTPMTAIMGYTDLIANGCPGACGFGREMLVNHIDVICRNADLLLQIINDILDLSKIEAGRLEVERVACSPWQIVCDVVGLLKVQAAGKGLELRVERAGPIPKTIQSDPIRLRQILVNLIGNAIKFTEAGEVRVVVGLVSDPAKGTQLRIEVIDTGVGMAEEQLAKLFRPFSQADSSTTRRFGGTGLGLTISKRLAELLGGDLHVASAIGQGSTFTLTVEANSPEGVEPSDSLAPPDGRSAEASSQTPTKTPAITGSVLLAEDGRDNQRLIELVLRKAGAAVALAENGQVALDLALAAREQGKAFDVILMDMQMPVMDGYESTRRLRAEGWTGPIVALTAHAMAGDRDKCVAAGCTDYVSKPIDRGKLLTRLAQYVGVAKAAAAP